MNSYGRNEVGIEAELTESPLKLLVGGRWDLGSVNVDRLQASLVICV